MSRVYLDYNATAPLRPEARAAVIDGLQAGNPSSVHYEGSQARALIDGARRQIAAPMQCQAGGSHFHFRWHGSVQYGDEIISRTGRAGCAYSGQCH